MSSLFRYSTQAHAPWSLVLTSLYTGEPAADTALATSAFPVGAITFDGQLLTLTTPTVTTAHLGVLFTFATGAHPALGGVRIKCSPTYTGTLHLAVWTFDGTTWARRARFTHSAVNEGAPTGIGKVHEWLTTAADATTVTHLWITYEETITAANLIAVHLYHYATEGLIAPYFDPLARAMGYAPPTFGSDGNHTLSPNGGSFVNIARIADATPPATVGLPFALAYALDLTPDASDDEIGAATASGAWSVVDYAASAVAAASDAAGEDLLVLAYGSTLASGLLASRLWLLDWTRERDEATWGLWDQIYRRLRLGPIPHVPDADNTETSARYALDWVKRFRQFQFELRDRPTDALSRVRLTVREWDGKMDGAYGSTRTTDRIPRIHNVAKIAVAGIQWDLLLEHTANEPFRLAWWLADFDLIGKRVPDMEVA